MAMAETRAMDNMVVMVATKVMVIKAGMVAIKAMAVSLIRVMANKATVPNRDTANKVMAINKALTATASSKVTQGAVMEPTTDLTSLAPTMIRVMGSKATTVATRAMDSKEATVETKAMANKTTMVPTPDLTSLAPTMIRAPNT